MCWDSGSHRSWTVPFWALLLSRRAARVQMWVWVVSKPCPGCRVPVTSVPRLSPAAPLVQLAPQNPWLGVLHLPKLSPNFASALLASPLKLPHSGAAGSPSRTVGSAEVPRGPHGMGGPLQTSSYLEMEKSASLGEGHIMEAKEEGSERPGDAGGLLPPVRTRGHGEGWPGLGGRGRARRGHPARGRDSARDFSSLLLARLENIQSSQ